MKSTKGICRISFPLGPDCKPHNGKRRSNKLARRLEQMPGPNGNASAPLLIPGPLFLLKESSSSPAHPGNCCFKFYQPFLSTFELQRTLSEVCGGLGSSQSKEAFWKSKSSMFNLSPSLLPPSRSCGRLMRQDCPLWTRRWHFSLDIPFVHVSLRLCCHRGDGNQAHQPGAWLPIYFKLPIYLF